MGELLHKQLTHKVIGAAMEVHRELGPGFLEAVYQGALAYELHQQGLFVQQQVQLLVTYKGIAVGHYQADFLIEDDLILELKAVSALHPQHYAQTINYLAATQRRLALLLNFGTTSLQWKRLIR